MLTKRQVVTYLTLIIMLLLFVIPPVAQPNYFNPSPTNNWSPQISENQATETLTENPVNDQQIINSPYPMSPGVSFLPSDHRDSTTNFTYVNGETSVNTSLTNLVNNANITVFD